MRTIIQWEFLEEWEDEQEVICANGAYTGNTSWDGERYADAAIADEQRWRRNVCKGISEIKALRVAWENSKKLGNRVKMRMLEEDIKQKKEELKKLITSRDYEFR